MSPPHSKNLGSFVKFYKLIELYLSVSVFFRFFNDKVVIFDFDSLLPPVILLLSLTDHCLLFETVETDSWG